MAYLRAWRMDGGVAGDGGGVVLEKQRQLSRFFLRCGSWQLYRA